MTGIFFTDLPELTDVALRDAPDGYKHLALDTREEREYYHHWYEEEYQEAAWEAILNPHESTGVAGLAKIIIRREQAANEWGLYKEWLERHSDLTFDSLTPGARLREYFKEQEKEVLK